MMKEAERLKNGKSPRCGRALVVVIAALLLTGCPSPITSTSMTYYQGKWMTTAEYKAKTKPNVKIIVGGVKP